MEGEGRRGNLLLEDELEGENQSKYQWKDLGEYVDIQSTFATTKVGC